MATEPRSDASPGDASADSGAADPRLEIVRDELERRLRRFDELDDSAFGSFSALDWALCTLLFFLAPLVIVWWAF